MSTMCCWYSDEITSSEGGRYHEGMALELYLKFPIGLSRIFQEEKHTGSEQRLGVANGPENSGTGQVVQLGSQ